MTPELKKELIQSSIDAAICLIEKLEVRILQLELAFDGERQRCINIVTAARFDLIDCDLRSVRAWIESGDSPPEDKE